ncbi:MAG: permease [Longimicrobiales bacterium]|nr:permease [Longimicrobiales bacterium]
MYTSTVYLLAASLAPVAAPLMLFLVRERQGPFRFMDGFVMLAVPGLVFLHVVPESIDQRDLVLALALLAGLLAPGTLERITRDVAHRTDRLALVLGISGLALHAVLEGAAIVPMGGPEDLGFALAIVLHRIPVGLAVWWLVRDVYDDRLALLALLSVAALTLAGYGGGGGLVEAMGGRGVELYTAFVSGTLVHVAFHQIGHHRTSRPGRLDAGLEGLGAVLALALLLSLGVIEGEAAHAAVGMLHRFLVLAAESAPALLLAYIFAGALQAFLPVASIRWMSRGGRLGSAMRGMAVGLPFPICSCGVVPLYRTLVQRGAPAAAAMAFLVATPELGLDAVLLSIPLLGPEMTVARVATAAVAALVVGWLVGGRLKAKAALPVMGGDGPAEEVSVRDRLRLGARAGFGEVVDHTAPWIVVGLLIAAVASPLLEGGWLTRIPPVADVLLFALLGFPTYVCASSATPLVATLVATGLSPGAAIAFLITGPATNATTFGVVASLHGRRAAVAFAATLVGVAVGAGLVINFAFGSFSGPTLAALVEEPPGLLHQVSLVLLGALFLASVLRQGIRRFVGELRVGLGDGGSSVPVVG